MDLIRRGQTGAAVADVQTRLERLGFEIAPPERGVFGATTEAAVRAFQQRRGLDVDGIVGPITWRELVEASWALGDRILRLREPPMRGDDVRELQARLNALGFTAGKHDGIFGPTTAGALREFQRNLAIDEDGIAGRETFRALDRLTFFTRHTLGTGPRTRERLLRGAGRPGIADKRLAIDPGHGGPDPGEPGPVDGGEAAAAFALAARVAHLLDASGAQTMLTRGPHDGPADSERARLANEFGADLFLSIHFNAHQSEAAEGAAAYFFEREGVASEPGEHLAELLLAELTATGRQSCRSHGKAYPVLRETRMPAVAVEPCFISNPAEAKLLSDPASLDELARAIVRAIRRYFSEESGV